MTETLKQFIDDHVAVIDPLNKNANLAYWDFTTTGNKQSESTYASLQASLRRVYADSSSFEQLKNLTDSASADDGLLGRQATLLTYAFTGNQMDEEALEEVTQQEVAIESVFNQFRAELGGRKVTENELNNILRESVDSDFRRQAWEASKQIGFLVADELLELVDLRNRAARKIGFDNYYLMHLVLQELDERELFATFDDLDRQVSDFYRSYKTGLDADLASQFDIGIQDLRPWHYSDPFFQDAPVADLSVRSFLDGAFAEQDVEVLTRRFFQAVGLDIDDVLERSDLYEREGKQQHAYCIHVDRSRDVRVLCNIRPNDRWMGTMLHEFGHAAYDKYLDVKLPYILRQPAHILLTEAVAMLMGRLATDVDWLVLYAGVAAEEAEELSLKLRQQLVGSLLITSRWVPVMSHFERSLYADPTQDLNKLWWDLVEHFQMLSRPEGRNAPDWAAKIHFSIAPVYYHNYLLGELIASQLRNCIEQTVLGDGANAGRDFVSDPAVGSYLIEKVFRPGAVRHWQEALVYATGQELQPHYFVEQVGN